MRSQSFHRIVVVVAALGLATSVFAQAPAPAANPIIYPAKGQSDTQMTKDKSECATWATKQTGFDPVAELQKQQAQAQATQQQQAAANDKAQQQAAGVGGERAGGAVKGAAAGAVVGAVTGDAGQGAAVGAAAGVMAGGARQRGKKKAIAAEQQAATQATQQQAADAQAASNQKLADYNRAVNACLEGRGYTIK
jgi:hypothetical protein